MRTETLIRMEGMNALLEKLGKVDAERFVARIIKEPFDYTKWQENILNNMTVRELSKNASEFVNRNNIWF
ncbi:MAG: hypothetical protein A2Y24_07125 [Clostridiales bacterium GWE2_32_10]|nr:MAG: hypothetical protein A2Y24_07125 [Clostridiales bacterium GWE2_32_10]HBY20488.1 hypothetical protein [Clostridiales bacterium]